MYHVSSSAVFFFVSYMHIHAPFKMYWPRLSSFPRNAFFNHDDVTLPLESKVFKMNVHEYCGLQQTQDYRRPQNGG